MRTLRPSLLRALAVASVVAIGLFAPPGPRSARALPLEHLPVGHPLERELRLLDLLPADDPDRIRLPHLHSRPLRLEELGGARPAAEGELVRGISEVRLGRWLARDLAAWQGVPGATPRLVALHPDARSRLEASAALEGRAEAGEPDSEVLPGSGAHLRLGAGLDRFVAFADLFVGRIAGAPDFTDPLVQDTEVTFTTEDSWVGWMSESGALEARFGRTRWHWGPGEEAGLLLSRSSEPLSGLSVRAGTRAYGLDFTVLNATLARAEGRQLAAHRLEWQPLDGLRLGLMETAVYHSTGWAPLYAVGIIPYSVVQRIDDQTEPDSSSDLRNNVTAGFDVAWRLAPGSRVYAEMVIDDLVLKTATVPNKLGYLLGWEGVGRVGGTRVAWVGEWARLSRWVYTSYYDAALVAQDRPIGYPTGPDARRVRVKVTADLGADWQLLSQVSQTDKGENDLDEPYVPGDPLEDPMEFEGVVERTREVELGLRWWPAGGIDLAVTAGWRATRDAGHVPGDDREGAFGAIEVRLAR